MEFILITNDKLKIIMSKRDLEEFDITADDLDYSNVDTKRMFWDILGRAKRSVGFSCDGERVLVKLYASRDGGCEMFVSKLGAVDECDELCSADLRFKSPRSSFEYEKRQGAYRFDKLEWLIAVCRRLSEIGYSGNSQAFFDNDRFYYLFLDGLDATGYFKFDEFSFINEFGQSQNAEIIYEFLCEHGKAICKEDAVDTLSGL